MTKEQIKHMVDRFLGWRLPDNFKPDAGISYVPLPYAKSAGVPTGTNLFDATQTDVMVRYLIEGLPVAAAQCALADKLQSLCCAETESKFFDLVTDSIDDILFALRNSPSKPITAKEL